METGGHLKKETHAIHVHVLFSFLTALLASIPNMESGHGWKSELLLMPCDLGARTARIQYTARSTAPHVDGILLL